jgi:hypothetical protein
MPNNDCSHNTSTLLQSLLRTTFRVTGMPIEQELLGAVLHAGGAVIDAVDPIITATDFHESVHQTLYSSFVDAHSKGRAITPTLAIAALGAHGGLELQEDTTNINFQMEMRAMHRATLQARHRATQGPPKGQKQRNIRNLRKKIRARALKTLPSLSSGIRPIRRRLIGRMRSVASTV